MAPNCIETYEVSRMKYRELFARIIRENSSRKCVFTLTRVIR